MAQTNDARVRAGNVGLLTSVTLVQHKSRNLRFETPFAVVEVADPEIADARAISDRQLFILGKKIGATNVLLYDPSRQLIGVVDVEVKLDTRSLSSKIREGSGGKGIRVNDVDGKLVLSNAHRFYGFRAISHERAVLEDKFSIFPMLFPPYTARVKQMIKLAVRFLT